MEETLERGRGSVSAKIPPQDQRTVNREILKFILVFLGFLTITYGFYLHYQESPAMERYLALVSIPVEWCLKPFSNTLSRNGTHLTFNGFSMTIISDCSAIPSMTIFSAAVIAFPTRWRKRLVGLLMGIPFLFVVNVLRLACLAFIGSHQRSLERILGIDDIFHKTHVYVWQSIFIVFVIGIWLLWVVKVVMTTKREVPGEE